MVADDGDLRERIRQSRAALQSVGALGAVVVEDMASRWLQNFRFVQIQAPGRMNEWGRGLTHPQAVLGGLMERVERVSAMLAPKHYGIVRSTPDALNGTALTLQDLGLCNFQRYLHRGDEFLSLPNDYVQMSAEGQGGGTTYAPASRVFGRHLGPVEDFSCSTGLAAHFDPSEAKRRALIEVLERHFHHVSKFNDVPLHRLPLDLVQMTEQQRLLLEELEAGGHEVQAYSVPVSAPLFGVWVTVTRRPSDWTQLPFGAVAHFGLHGELCVAIERALTESLVSRGLYCLRHGERRSRKRSQAEERFAIRLQDAEDAGEVPVPDHAGAQAVEQVLAGLRTRAFFCDLTHPAMGIPVFRALVPGVQPNFDLMGLSPTHPNARITNHLQGYPRWCEEVRAGVLATGTLDDRRDNAKASHRQADSAGQSLAVSYKGPKVSLSTASSSALSSAIAKRRTRRSISGKLTLSELATLLESAVGPRIVHYSVRAGFLSQRRYPSGGALHPLEFFLEARNVEGLPHGIYHYGDDSSLTALGPLQSPLAERYCRASAIVWIVYRRGRNSGKYGPNGLDLALIESGHVGQNMLLLAQGLGLNAVPFGTFSGWSYGEHLRRSEAPIYAIGFGHDA